MNSELVLRLIALVQRNGDRVVLADQNTGEGVVVMDLASYEALSAAKNALEDSARSAAGSAGSTSTADQPLPLAMPEHKAPVLPPVTPAQANHVAPRGRPAQPKPQIISEAPVQILETTPVAQSGRKPTSTFSSGPATAGLGDLTQQELLDKINRDIGEWKNAKETRLNQESQTVAQQPQAPAGALEEEERFYLEPIE